MRDDFLIRFFKAKRPTLNVGSPFGIATQKIILLEERNLLLPCLFSPLLRSSEILWIYQSSFIVTLVWSRLKCRLKSKISAWIMQTFCMRLLFLRCPAFLTENIHYCFPEHINIYTYTNTHINKYKNAYIHFSHVP